MANISSGKSIIGSSKAVSGEGSPHNKVSAPVSTKASTTGKAQSYGANAAKLNAYNADVAMDAGGSTGS